MKRKRKMNTSVKQIAADQPKRKRVARCFMSFVPLLFLAGQVSAQEPVGTGFLPSADYKRLEKVAVAEEGVTLYRYLNPNFDIAKYSKIMLDPVMLYQTAFANQDGETLSEETLYQARANIDAALKVQAEKKFPVVHLPDPQVVRVSIAITGMEVEGEGFKPRNILPVSAVLFAAKKVTDLDTKRLVLVVEAKVRDSMSGEIMGEGVYTMTGDKFRHVSDTGEMLRDLAVEWAATAVRLASGLAASEQ